MTRSSLATDAAEDAGTVAGVILAGGEGHRLGGAIKANITIGGVRLLERACGALRGSVGTILVAHGRLDAGVLDLPPGAIAVADLDGPVRGPLAGLVAAAAWCSAQPVPPRLIVSVAVDTPFFPHDFAARAVPALTPAAGAVVAACEGQEYPTNAVWRLEALRPLLDPALAERIAPGGIKSLLRQIGAVPLDWPTEGRGNPFDNLNTPEDARALELRAASHAPSDAHQIGVGKGGQTR